MRGIFALNLSGVIDRVHRPGRLDASLDTFGSGDYNILAIKYTTTVLLS